MILSHFLGCPYFVGECFVSEAILCSFFQKVFQFDILIQLYLMNLSIKEGVKGSSELFTPLSSSLAVTFTWISFWCYSCCSHHDNDCDFGLYRRHFNYSILKEISIGCLTVIDCGENRFMVSYQLMQCLVDVILTIGLYLLVCFHFIQKFLTYQDF